MAVIGYGLAGASFHAPVIAATPGLRLATIVTSNAERAAAARAHHEAVEIVPAAEDLWARPDRHDLVVVAAHNRAHVPLGLAAIEAGLPVVIDKPVAPASKGAERLGAAARVAQVPVVPFHNRRWDGDFLTLRRLLSEDELGDVLRYESRFERWRPMRRAGARREQPGADDAGGVLFDLGTHLIDQALALFGPVVAVYAETETRQPGLEVDDDAFVALAHASGVRSHLWASHMAADRGPRLRVLGSRAAYVKHGMDVQAPSCKPACDPATRGSERNRGRHGERWARASSRARYRPRRATTRGSTPMWRPPCVDGTAPPVSLDDAIHGLRIIEAAFVSSRAGVVARPAGAPPDRGDRGAVPILAWTGHAHRGDPTLAETTSAWQDTSLSPRERAEKLVEAMTLEQKIAQLHGAMETIDIYAITAQAAESGADMDQLAAQIQIERHVPAIEELGIPRFRITNGPVGVGMGDGTPSPPATSLPMTIGLAAGFDPELAHAYGDIIGSETATLGQHVLEGPGVCLHRTTIAGRNFEYFSEDPYLSGVMGVAVTKAIQAHDVIAMAKHYVVNDQEYERFRASVEVDEHVLRELYLLPFEMLVKDAEIAAIMSAYNRVRGVYATEYRYTLTDILRTEWGFDGYVQSDFWSCRSCAPSLNAGMDHEMPDAKWLNEANVKAALQDTSLEIETVDRALVRRYTQMFRFGQFERPYEPGEIDAQAHGAVARTDRLADRRPAQERRRAAAARRRRRLHRHHRPVQVRRRRLPGRRRLVQGDPAVHRAAAGRHAGRAAGPRLVRDRDQGDRRRRPVQPGRGQKRGRGRPTSWCSWPAWSRPRAPTSRTPTCSTTRTGCWTSCWASTRPPSWC